MIPEWISFQNDSNSRSFHVYIEVLILKWKCGKSIGRSKTRVKWSAQPIHEHNSVPEWTRASFTWYLWNVRTDFVLEQKFRSGATTRMNSGALEWLVPEWNFSWYHVNEYRYSVWNRDEVVTEWNLIEYRVNECWYSVWYRDEVVPEWNSMWYHVNEYRHSVWNRDGVVLDWNSIRYHVNTA